MGRTVWRRPTSSSQHQRTPCEEIGGPGHDVSVELLARESAAHTQCMRVARSSYGSSTATPRTPTELSACGKAQPTKHPVRPHSFMFDQVGKQRLTAGP